MPSRGSRGEDPQEEYFVRFPNFVLEESTSLVHNFDRLALSRGWSKAGKRYRKERQACFEHEFNRQFGQDESRLSGWQRLCRDVSVEPQNSITRCKKVLSSVAVNIVDLIDHRRTGSELKVFSTKAQLRRYSVESGKIFNKKKAKQDGFLSALLIRMF